MTQTEHQHVIDTADKALQHELVSEVIQELADNLRVSNTGLPAMGFAKVASYAGQVAITMSWGLDPEDLKTPIDKGDFDCCVSAVVPPIADDPVNHPGHYTSHPSGVECIQITEQKVIPHPDHPGTADLYDALEDLEKARWYIEREIERRAQQ